MVLVLRQNREFRFLLTQHQQQNCCHGNGTKDVILNVRVQISNTEEVTTSKGKSAKELMIRKMHSPRQAILILTGHDPT